MIDPGNISHKGLKHLWTKNDVSKLNHDWVPRLKRYLSALHVAVSPEELKIPGWHWHMLSGDRQGTYSLRVSGNWRLTFKWDEDGPYDINLEDYHAR